MIFKILLCLLLTSCAKYHIKETLPNGNIIEVEITQYITDTKIDTITYRETKNGTKEFSVSGYISDQTKAVGIAVDAAVKAAISSIKPI